MKNKFVYVFAFADEYELPLMVADTLDEVSKEFNFSWACLQRALLRNSLIAGMYKIRRVDIMEPKDKFNDFEEYKLFCSEHGLRENNSKSLYLFKEFCFRDELCLF